MKNALMVCLLSAVCMTLSFAADMPGSVIGNTLDRQVTMIEKELVPLADAMPADKFDFAPTNGAFSGVRTFQQQVEHVAAVIYAVSAAVMEQPNPSEMGKGENGPASLKTKDDTVKYLKDAFAYAHKAMGTITDRNATESIKPPYGTRPAPRFSIATEVVWHSFDHYGQMVVYARMNGIVPPASR